LGLLYRRYFGILGANRRVSAEQQDYERLWNSLAEGNMAARLYAARLAKFLDWIDHFFGDAGMADRTLFPHAFGLKTPAPLWTAPSLDCCLFLALLYPIATISAIWAISAHPTSPEYWWIYTLLLSTLIPSLANLVIGSTSLVRGLPGVPLLLLDFMPKRGGVLKWDRHWIATVLTAQVAAGAFLGIAAQIFLVWVIIGYLMPLFGLELLDMARDLAAFNLPARVGHLFGASL
jgi:hypothetical protein